MTYPVFNRNHSSYHNFGSFLWLPLFQFLFLTYQLHAVVFEVEGDMSVTPHYGAESNKTSLKLKYHVIVEQNQWYIRYDDLEAISGKNESATTEELVFDGTDMFALAHWARTKSKLVTDPHSTATGLSGSAYKTSFPDKYSTFQRVLWLVFCSGDYLATHSNFPAIQGAFTPETELVTSFFSRLPNGNLPGECSQMMPGFSTEYNGTNYIRMNFPPPYNLGYTGLVYEVITHTNVNNNSIPTLFSFKWSGARFTSSNRVDIVPDWSYTGRVTALRTETTGIPSLDISNPLIISDHRFANSNGPALRYYEKEGAKWLDRADPDFRNTIKSKTPVKTFVRKPAANTRWVIGWLLFSIVVFSPMIFFLLRCRKITNRKPKQL